MIPPRYAANRVNKMKNRKGNYSGASRRWIDNCQSHLRSQDASITSRPAQKERMIKFETPPSQTKETKTKLKIKIISTRIKKLLVISLV